MIGCNNLEMFKTNPQFFNSKSAFAGQGMISCKYFWNPFVFPTSVLVYTPWCLKARQLDSRISLSTRAHAIGEPVRLHPYDTHYTGVAVSLVNVQL